MIQQNQVNQILALGACTSTKRVFHSLDLHVHMCNFFYAAFFCVLRSSPAFSISSWSLGGVGETTFLDPCPNIFHCQLNNGHYKSSQENQGRKDDILIAQYDGIINAIEFFIDCFCSAINLAHYSTLYHLEEMMIKAFNQL